MLQYKLQLVTVILALLNSPLCAAELTTSGRTLNTINFINIRNEVRNLPELKDFTKDEFKDRIKQFKKNHTPSYKTPKPITQWRATQHTIFEDLLLQKILTIQSRKNSMKGSPPCNFYETAHDAELLGYSIIKDIFLALGNAIELENRVSLLEKINLLKSQKGSKNNTDATPEPYKEEREQLTLKCQLYEKKIRFFLDQYNLFT